MAIVYKAIRHGESWSTHRLPDLYTISYHLFETIKREDTGFMYAFTGLEDTIKFILHYDSGIHQDIEVIRCHAILAPNAFTPTIIQSGMQLESLMKFWDTTYKHLVGESIPVVQPDPRYGYPPHRDARVEYAPPGTVWCKEITPLNKIDWKYTARRGGYKV